MSRSYLDALGVARQKQPTQELEPFAKFSELLANSFVAKMRDYYTKNNINASFQLAQSLDYNISTPAGSYNIIFTTDAEYFDVREKGISGTETKRNTPYSFKTSRPSKGMAQDINQWMRDKGVPAFPNKTFEQTSWMRATSIKKKGYEGAFMLDNVFTQQEFQNIQDSLLTLTNETIEVRIKAVVPESNIRE
jgi:hypothetical protein